MTWIINNIGTIIVLLLLAAAVILVIRRIIKDKAAGKCSCGGNCGACASHSKCNGVK